jgi:oligoribonuclease NrnB/cAMP/cGMP phosphodiesterase (DHH superfamily)
MGIATHVIYHKGCIDGFAAAFCFYERLGKSPQYIPMSYGDPVPDLPKDAEVTMVDFSLKRDQHQELVAKVKEVFVLDHHASAEREVGGLPKVRIDQEKSGVRLAYDYMIGGFSVPWWVAAIEDQDLWKFKRPGTREINAALSSLPYDFEVWRSYLEDGEAHAIREGTAIYRYIQQKAQHAAEKARTVSILGHEVPCVNATLHISEIGHILCQGKPFAATYFDNEDGQRVWSLRSDEDGVDVSKIAERHGGGGHRHAAGFRGQPKAYAEKEER